MLKAVKPALAKELTKSLSQQAQKGRSLTEQFIVHTDGGALLHNVRWTKNTTVCDIIKIYIGVLRRRYGQSAIVVFDGYSGGATTKDHEHKRRFMKASRVAAKITLSLDTCKVK